jgi:CRP/FNR family transcriptional regulator, anaerobic regulatory protein
LRAGAIACELSARSGGFHFAEDRPMEADRQPRMGAAAPMPEFLAREVRTRGRRVGLDSGQYFLHCGQEVADFAVLRSGLLRVFTQGDNGREITLYSVGPGECCLINVLCLIGGMRCPAAAVAEEPVEAVVFPGRTFLSWLEERADVRAYVFGLMASRVGSMMALVEEVAFQRLDCRLAGYLWQRAARGPEIATTHDAVAAELGTAREVVSRLLKSFERQGAVFLARGSITVTDPGYLQRLAGGTDAGRDAGGP